MINVFFIEKRYEPPAPMTIIHFFINKILQTESKKQSTNEYFLLS